MRPVTAVVNTPVPAASAATCVTSVPPICGSALADVSAYTTPRAVTLAPPSAVTFPPSAAPDAVIDALVGVVTVGAVAVPSRVTVTV